MPVCVLCVSVYLYIIIEQLFPSHSSNALVPIFQYYYLSSCLQNYNLVLFVPIILLVTVDIFPLTKCCRFCLTYRIIHLSVWIVC